MARGPAPISDFTPLVFTEFTSLTDARARKMLAVLAAPEPSQSTAIVSLIVGLAFFLVTLTTLISISALWWEDWNLNRRMKDAERPPPEEERDLQAIVAQLGPMSMANIMAGALAGIGASLFVDNGRLRRPSSQIPYALIALALALTVFTAMALTAYIRRPRPSWVGNTSSLRSHLRRVNEQSRIGESDLAEARELRSRWAEDTVVRPLRRVNELRELGLELPAAYEEWNSATPYDPIRFGAKLKTEISAKQVRRWIGRKRLWRLGIPPFASGLALAGIIIIVIALGKFTIWSSALVYTPIVCLYTVLLYWWAFRTGRLDLMATNRLFALERSQLDDCDRLIEQIEKKFILGQLRSDQRGRLILGIGRWELRLRNDEV